MYDGCLILFLLPLEVRENKKELTSCLDSFAPFRVGKTKELTSCLLLSAPFRVGENKK
jgi:hypothetical protein